MHKSVIFVNNFFTKKLFYQLLTDCKVLHTVKNTLIQKVLTDAYKQLTIVNPAQDNVNNL